MWVTTVGGIRVRVTVDYTSVRALIGLGGLRMMAGIAHPLKKPAMRYQTGLHLLAIVLCARVAAQVSAPAALTEPVPVSTQAPAVAPGTTATVALLETSDLHANVVGYDYYKLAPDATLGLDRTATLIGEARRQYPNNLLFDNGDTIQGTALADYQALAGTLPCQSTLAIYKMMNQLHYDGGAIGNHEFNYGLPFLNQVTGSQFDVAGVDPTAPRCAGPNFPQVLANVYSLKTHQPLFAPYRIIDKQITALDAQGKPVTATLKVGIIGFAPPTILSWDKRHLEGKVYTIGLREAALRYMPEMRAKGAQLIVVISHGGLDDAPYSAQMENGNYHLAQIDGIDAMLLGHSHQVFPNAASTVGQFNLSGVDKARGMVHGVPTVMPSLWGKHLGVIALNLTYDGARWVVDKSRTLVEARATQRSGALVAPDGALTALVAPEHAATIAYVRTPIGATDFRMTSYFADVGDVSAIAAVNLAQADYVARYVKANLPQYAGLPVLSMASPFKGGLAGASDYTDVAACSLALNNAADLYLYPNSLAAVKIRGAVLASWLERSAGRFNTINPALNTPQELINQGFPAYNFDAPTSADISSEIDVTQPAGKRIANLRYRGKPIGADDQFVVATNNYRASGGGSFPGLDGAATLFTAPDSNRDVLIAYVKTAGKLTRAVHGQARSWRFIKVRTAGPVVVHAPPGLLELSRQAGVTGLTQMSADDGQGKGLGVYAIDLAR